MLKIVYGAGNRTGSDSQLLRFLDNVNKNYEIKIAAYLKSSESLPHIDWTLDALHYKPSNSYKIKKLFGHSGPGFLNAENAKLLINDIAEFGPDLIISDGEYITANVAKTLSVRLWYCSPLHLFDGIIWERNQIRYAALLSKLRPFLRALPEADKIFVYSPFGDIKFRPTLRDGYEWIKPYYRNVLNKNNGFGLAIVPNTERISVLSKMLNCVEFNLKLFSNYNEKFSNIKTENLSQKNEYDMSLCLCSWIFSTGETSFISDAFYNEKYVCISPSLNDFESILNAILYNNYNLGNDIGQIELAPDYAVEQVEKSFTNIFRKNYLSVQNRSFLHERVDGLCNM